MVASMVAAVVTIATRLNADYRYNVLEKEIKQAKKEASSLILKKIRMPTARRTSAFQNILDGFVLKIQSLIISYADDGR